MILSRKKKYLQVALNSTLAEARSIIMKLPVSDRIIIEAGTPLIKEYGSDAISQLYAMWSMRVQGQFEPYIVADLKTMDRAEREVQLSKESGASAAVCLGLAPIETVTSFIAECAEQGMDSMVDMMNVEHPIKVLRQYKQMPDVVILHRGVDEEKFNKNKPIPYVQIHKIRSSYNVMISMAGGDTIREVQRAVFNDANIVVVWKEFYSSSGSTQDLAADFLRQIK